MSLSTEDMITPAPKQNAPGDNVGKLTSTVNKLLNSGIETQTKLPQVEKTAQDSFDGSTTALGSTAKYNHTYPDKAVVDQTGMVVKILPSVSADNLLTGDIDEIIADHLAVYELYDGLQRKYPGTISSSVIGTDTAGNDIKQYTFKNGGLKGGHPNAAVKPSLVILSGLHGHEQLAVLVTFLLLRKVCDEWRYDEDMLFLKWCCEITVIPCANPSGIDLRQRNSQAGVDLNRNFPTGWNDVDTGFTEPDPFNSYKGPSAASEPEVQAIISFMATKTSSYYIDHHNHDSAVGAQMGFWVGMDSTPLLTRVARILNEADANAKRTIPEYLDSGDNFSSLTVSSDGTSVKHFDQRSEARAILAETPFGILEKRPSDLHQRKRDRLFNLACLTSAVKMCLQHQIEV